LLLQSSLLQSSLLQSSLLRDLLLRDLRLRLLRLWQLLALRRLSRRLRAAVGGVFAHVVGQRTVVAAVKLFEPLLNRRF
jgi:hypothetical protein